MNTDDMYEAAINAYYRDEPAAYGQCAGCWMQQVARRPIRRDDGMVWLVCERCLTHNHLRACRVCDVALPVSTAQIVSEDGQWVYCPSHPPDSPSR